MCRRSTASEGIFVHAWHLALLGVQASTPGGELARRAMHTSSSDRCLAPRRRPGMRDAAGKGEGGGRNLRIGSTRVRRAGLAVFLDRRIGWSGETKGVDQDQLARGHRTSVKGHSGCLRWRWIAPPPPARAPARDFVCNGTRADRAGRDWAPLLALIRLAKCACQARWERVSSRDEGREM